MVHHTLPQSATPGGPYPPKRGIDVYPLNRVDNAKHMKSNKLIFLLARGEGGTWTCPPPWGTKKTLRPKANSHYGNT